MGFERLIDHPLRTRESVNAAETPICSITGYKAFREAMAKVYPKGHTGCAYMLFASQPAIYDAILDQDPYPIRAVIVQSGEPLLTMGGAQKAYEAFTSPNLELLVVMDFWKTPTAQLADYVLPAADFLERPDITSHWGIGNFFVVGAEVRRAALRAPQRLRAVGGPRPAPARPGRVAGDARGDARPLPRAVGQDLRGVGER